MTHCTVMICPSIYGTQLSKANAAIGSVKKKTKNLRSQALPTKYSDINRSSASAKFARMIPGHRNVDKRCGFAPRIHPEAQLNPMRPARCREIGELGTMLLGSRTLTGTHDAYPGSHQGVSANARVRPYGKKRRTERSRTYSDHSSSKSAVHVPYSSVI